MYTGLYHLAPIETRTPRPGSNPRPPGQQPSTVTTVPPRRTKSKDKVGKLARSHVEISARKVDRVTLSLSLLTVLALKPAHQLNRRLVFKPHQSSNRKTAPYACHTSPVVLAQPTGSMALRERKELTRRPVCLSDLYL